MPARALLGFTCVLLIFVAVSSCQDLQLDDSVSKSYLDLPVQRYQYNNPLDTSNAVSTLGRVLFYDRAMSLNGNIACASCHKQQYGFADNVAFSRGFEGRVTTRNSMPIQNFISFIEFFNPDGSTSIGEFGGTHFFWDGREQSLQNLILQPVGNHIEMGMSDIDALTKKISEQPYYASLFRDAFGTPDAVTGDNISLAVSMFLEGISTNHTRFDQYNLNRGAVAAGGPDQFQTILSPLETEGMLLFQQKYDCNSCHHVESTIGYQAAGTFANIGLDATYGDPGLADVTNNPADVGKFKIPSLRNVEYTAPYMHDGRFATLEDVVEHYSEGIANHPNLDPKLKDNGGLARTMNISDHEKQAIVAFLRTLSDQSPMTDPKYSNPFKAK
jgi:cytochrome c peroxidase